MSLIDPNEAPPSADVVNMDPDRTTKRTTNNVVRQQSILRLLSSFAAPHWKLIQTRDSAKHVIAHFQGSSISFGIEELVRSLHTRPS